jgi:DNA modification methylase
LIIDCVKAGCPENGVVIDPFIDSGTTGIIAKKLNRNYIGIELKPQYIEIAQKRIQKEVGQF